MYFLGVSRGKNIKYKKVTVFYEIINGRCIIFLFLLQSLFSTNKNVEIFFFFFRQCANFYFGVNLTAFWVLYEDIVHDIFDNWPHFSTT